MCVSPVPILNKNRGSKSELMRLSKDCDSIYIYVPCNVCSECLAKRQMEFVQRARTMCLDHYVFFCTLTYNNESIPKVITSQGFTIKYVDKSDVQNMHKRIRKGNLFGREYHYFFVSERGSAKGRPHVHGLIFIPKFKDDDKLYPAQLETTVRRVLFKEWRRNYGSSRNPDWKPLFTYKEKYVAGKLTRNFDCHYVTAHTSDNGPDDVAFYVTKYILKPSDKERRLQQALRLNLVKVFDDGFVDNSEYEQIWSTVRSRAMVSKKFGDLTKCQVDHVKKGISISADNPDGLKYFTSSGDFQPLARFYRKYVGLEDGLKSISATGGPFKYSDRSLSNKMQSVDKGSVILSKVSHRDVSELFPD